MILRAENICKRFGATLALDKVTAEFRSGEVNALVGENGAGQSTLLKVVAAVHHADSGTMTLDGKPYSAVNPTDAARQGVAIVFQESTINPSISIAENVFIDRLHRYSTPLFGMNWKKLKKDAQGILDQMDAGIDVNGDLHKLDLGKWKLIEVARALSYNPQVLLLDESTAFLSLNESKAFIKSVKNLRESGLALGFVSHHMSEVFELADYITVMRDGKFITEMKREDATEEKLEDCMVGRQIGDKMYPARRATPASDEILKVENISIEGKLKDISFTLHRGEILGIGGLNGSGGDSILDAIYGACPVECGKITMNGETYHKTTPEKSIKRGLALLPGERTLEGLIVNFSIADNIVMSAGPKKGPLRDWNTEGELVTRYIKEVLIKTNDPKNAASSLSGGNMQKVVIGKCLAPQPEVLLMNNPTRGIDISARQEIYSLIRKLADNGLAIIMLTEDMLELLGMSDRIMITRDNKISKIFDENVNLKEEDLIGYIV
ncbi:MAG: sugar ABC transporter ATP-binding protein [Oscillospiraceae bacterium]|nr:sugar ABC transporter ATP-binding protein [Oscillospiraceae bacterium]